MLYRDSNVIFLGWENDWLPENYEEFAAHMA